MRLFKKRNLELENWMLTHFEWDYVSSDELVKLGYSFAKDEFYGAHTAGKILNAEAVGLFKKICSQIGVSYYDVEKLFKKQNQDFFKLTKHLMQDSQKHHSDEGRVYAKMFYSLIVPKQTNAEKLLNKFRKLSPEEQLVFFQNKKAIDSVKLSMAFLSPQTNIYKKRKHLSP